MNKFVKGCLITAAVFLVVGFVLAGIGVAIGGIEGTKELARKGELTIGGDKFRILEERIGREVLEKAHVTSEEAYEEAYATPEDAYEETYEVHEGTIRMTIESGGQAFYDYKEVTDLAIEIGGVELIILPSDTEESEYFRIDNNTNKKVETYLENNTLVVRSWKKDLVGSHKRETIVLYVPKAATLEDVSMEVGAGFIEASQLEANEIHMEIGAGLIECREIKARTFQVEVGAGEFVGKQIETEDAELEAAVGAISFDGTIHKNLDANCDMGSIEMNLTGKENDYNYNVDCSVGSIAIGDQIYEGIGKEKYINNQSNYEFDLECAMGNIEIDFKE